jgi:hypothetical protein
MSIPLIPLWLIQCLLLGAMVLELCALAIFISILWDYYDHK